MYLVLVGPIVLIWSGLSSWGRLPQPPHGGDQDEVAVVARGALRLRVPRARRLRRAVGFISAPVPSRLLRVNLVFLVAERVTVRLVARRVRSSASTSGPSSSATRARRGDGEAHPRAPVVGLKPRPHPREAAAARRDDDLQRRAVLDARGLPARLEEFSVDEVPRRGPRRPPEDGGPLPLCEETGVKTRLVLDFFPHVLARVELEGAGRTPLPDVLDDVRRRAGMLAKRTVDVLLSILLGVVAVVPSRSAALLIRPHVEGARALFRQTRVGLAAGRSRS